MILLIIGVIIITSLAFYIETLGRQITKEVNNEYGEKL